MSAVQEDVLDVIIGAGPAGLQLAYHYKCLGLPYVVLERSGSAGAFFRRFPRHRTLLSINKIHVGTDNPSFRMRHDWNSLLEEDPGAGGFARFSRDYFPSADAMVAYLEDFAERHRLDIRFNREVTRVAPRPDGPGFLVRSADGATFPARRVIVATGLAEPCVPSVEGAELAEGYEAMSVDPDDYIDQNVLIIGKGNSALETANALLGTAARVHLISPHPVRFAWDTHHAGNIRSVNGVFFDSYLLKSLNGVVDGRIEWIRRRPDGKFLLCFASIHGTELETVAYDRILRCAGFAFDTSIFAPECRPALACGGKLPDLTGSWESRNVPGLFFAGALMQVLDFKKSQSSFVHGFRYNVRSLASLLAARSGAVALPHREAKRAGRFPLQRPRRPLRGRLGGGAGRPRRRRRCSSRRRPSLAAHFSDDHFAARRGCGTTSAPAARGDRKA
jgi:thioredoxin reductase